MKQLIRIITNCFIMFSQAQSTETSSRSSVESFNILNHNDPHLVEECISGTISSIRYLLDVKGVSPDSIQYPEFLLRRVGLNPCLAINEAALRGNLGVVDLLASRAACLCGRTSLGVESNPLQAAVAGGYLDIVKYLIDVKKVHVNHITIGGESPIMKGATSSYDIFIYLLERGADPRLTVDGYTPLHAAAIFCRLDITSTLLKRGVNPNITYQNYRATPLHVACELGAITPDYFDLMLSYGADFTLRDADGKTPLDYLNRRRHLQGWQKADWARIDLLFANQEL